MPTRPSPRPTATPRSACATCKEQLKYSVSAPVVKPSQGYPAERDFAKADYLAAVERAKELIAGGDFMQVQVGQRIKKRYTEIAAVAVPRAALAEPQPLHVLLPLRRLPCGGRQPGDPGAPGADRRGSEDHHPAAGGHPPARRHARAGQGRRGGTDQRPEGARRARDADRPGAQRHRPHRQDRQRQGDRGLCGRALQPRDAHREQRRGHAATTA